MIAASVIARLKAQASPPLAAVLGVMDLAAVAKGARPQPVTAYVFVAAERADPDERGYAGVLQRVTTEVSVIVAARNVAGTGAAQGFAGLADLEAAKAAVKAALIGWQPDGADDLITYAGGDLLEAIDGHATYELRWRTASLLGA